MNDISISDLYVIKLMFLSSEHCPVSGDQVDIVHRSDPWPKRSLCWQLKATTCLSHQSFVDVNMWCEQAVTTEGAKLPKVFPVMFHVGGLSTGSTLSGMA